jgi:hypothetical protein
MPQNEESHELRREILQLLCSQMQALQQLSLLSDMELLACYQRQERVSELRDQLFMALNSEVAPGSESGLSAASIASTPASSSATQAAVGM